MDGRSVTTLTGAEFTATQGHPRPADGGVAVLERTGWVHFDAEGLPGRIDAPNYTQAQPDAMFDLAMRHEPMRRRLLRELAHGGAGDG
jgi:hypothetical protein